MRGNTMSQITELREIQEEIPNVKEKSKAVTQTSSSERKEIDWWN